MGECDGTEVEIWQNPSRVGMQSAGHSKKQMDLHRCRCGMICKKDYLTQQVLLSQKDPEYEIVRLNLNKSF